MPTPSLFAQHQALAAADPQRSARLLQTLKPCYELPEALAVTRAPPATPVSPSAPLPRPRSGYRRNAIFALRSGFDWRLLDRNQRAKLWTIAQSMERRTKESGCRNGCLGAVGLTVLNALLFRFLSSADGRCDPSFSTLQRVTGLCRQSIANAIDRLEASGLVTVTRRMIRCTERVVSALDGREHQIVVTRQISNAYVLSNPATVSIPESRAHVPGRAFPRRRFNHLSAALAGLFDSISGRVHRVGSNSKHPLASRYEYRQR